MPKKVLLWSIPLLIILAGLLLVFINPLLNWRITVVTNQKLPQITGTPSGIDEVSSNIYQGKLEITTITIGNPEAFSTANAIAIPRVSIQFQPRSLLSDTFHVEKLVIYSPTVVFEQNHGRINLVELNRRIQQISRAKQSQKNNNWLIESILIKNPIAQINQSGKTYQLQLPDIRLDNVSPDGMDASQWADLIHKNLYTAITQSIQRNLSGEIATPLLQSIDVGIEVIQSQGAQLLDNLNDQPPSPVDMLRSILGN